jgi:effector-binding domain-containing protein
LDYIVQERTVKPRAIVSVRFTALDEELRDRIRAGLRDVGSYLERVRVEPYGPPLAVYHAAVHGLNDVEAGFPVGAAVRGEGRFAPAETPGGPSAVAHHLGPYEGLVLAYHAISVWAAEHDRRLAGPAWESYVVDPELVKDEARLETEVFWPLAGQSAWRSS